MIRKHILFAALLLSGLSSVEAGTNCPQFFVGGVSPALVNAKLAPLTRELCYSSFSLLHSGLTRSSLYAGEHLTRAGIKSGRDIERTNDFHPDPAVPASERAELQDYVRSGFDRGHLAPAQDMPDDQSMQESFTLANMIPQEPSNNRNLWKEVESSVRFLASRSGELYVITGPIYRGANVQSLRGRVLIPTHIYKAVYDPVRRVAGAYLVENVATSDWKEISISELRDISGIDVFPSLPENIKTQRIDLPDPITNRPKRSQRTSEPRPGFLERLLEKVY